MTTRSPLIVPKNYMITKPSKFHYLDLTQKAGIKTPATLFLSEKNLINLTFKEKLNNFIDQNKSPHYIVRSCIFGEDGTEQSFAGHFKSSGKTTPKNLEEIITQYFTDNKKIQKKICPNGKTNLMIQPFIQAKMGGVLFSPWKYFIHHFVGEVSQDGAQKAVEGRDTRFFLLSRNNQSKDLITIPNLPTKRLKETRQQCEEKFNFPLDIEWAFDGNQVVVLQIRPITKPLQAIKIANTKQIEAEKKYLQKTASGNWCINEFSESFGAISPLSFDVIKYCFEHNLENFKELGFRAHTFNFLAQSRNGQIYANPVAQSQFFKPRSFLTPFWQAVNEPKYKQKIRIFATTTQDNPFKLKKLSDIFGYWNIANFYARTSKNIAIVSWQNEYEVLQPLKLPSPKLKKQMNWSDWRNFYKQWWLWEYEKLKKDIQKNPLLAFGSLKTIKTNDEKTLQANYNKLLPYSILDFPYNFNQKSSHQKVIPVVKAKSIQGNIFIVKNPKIFNEPFPDNTILVAPYFSNDWILEMNKFKGIILENGGILSHSAIVAREKNIPYYIHWANATEHLKHGESLNLS